MIHRYYLPRCDRTSPMPCAPEGSSELPFIYKKNSINYILMFTVRKSKWNDNQISHLGVPKFLTFKTRLWAKPFLWNWGFICTRKEKHHFHINSFARNLALKLRLGAAWKLCSRKFDKNSWQDFSLNRPEAINCKFRVMSIYQLFLDLEWDISSHERFVWAKYRSKSAFCPFTI